MAFGLRNLELRGTIKSYDAAVRYHNNITPLKTTGIRHIGQRSSANPCSVHMLCGEVFFKLHNTNCVAYRPDGTVILNHGGYITNSTTTFINEIVPWPVHRRGGNMRVDVYGGTYQVSKGLMIRDNTVLNPTQEFEYILDKREATKIRKFMEPVLARCMSLMDATTPSRELRESYGIQCMSDLFSLFEQYKFGLVDEDELIIPMLYNCMFLTYQNGAYWKPKGTFECVRYKLYDRLGAYNEVAVPFGTLPTRKKK